MDVQSKRALKANGKTIEVEANATFRAVANALQVGKIALAGRASGYNYTLDDPVPQDATEVEIFTKDRGGLEVLRHSASHLMASAIKRLWPTARFGTGPATEKGFYYDVDIPHRLGDEDLRKIEAEMQKIVQQDVKFVRSQVAQEDAFKKVDSMGEVYKHELIRDHGAGGEKVFSFYSHGEFTDYCEGPHVPSTGWIKAIKLTDVSGSYWRGKEGNPQLQRVRGTAFFSDKDMKQYEKNIEEAQKRDHRKLGQALDLFSFSDYAPGIAFWHSRGMTIYNELLAFLREEYRKRGYSEVRAPLILNAELWKKSGHYDNYRENMFFTTSEDVEIALKPMNCPGHCVMFKERPRSYRDLPIRLAEMSPLHRNERSGTLHGLMRVRSFSQDDAHIFCREDQIESEVLGVISFLKHVYAIFGFENYRVELSTKPEKSIGSPEVWARAEAGLQKALEAAGLNYKLNPGDGAFYGPKIDFHITDALDRSWQCGTIQLDFNLPQRFELDFKGQDNAAHRPVMIHRALLGSFERMIGVLTEHWAGAFPLWLAPEQVRILPVAEAFAGYATEVKDKLVSGGVRAEVDSGADPLKARLKVALPLKIPYVLVVGDKEAQAKTVTVRRRGSDRQTTVSLDEFVGRAKTEIARRDRAPEETWPNTGDAAGGQES
ncbi:MAG TPA: threonine--tRNA ligase [Planctomycetota bacterium]|nr:threonine--tRNA ligase [Planctomycetota bacterium]